MNNRDQIFFYVNEGKRDQLEVAASTQKLWMSEWEIARLYELEVGQIREGIRGLIEAGEVESEGMVRFRSATGEDSRGPERAPDPLFHLKVVLALGLRVDSPQAVRFRNWAVESIFQQVLSLSGEDQFVEGGNSREYFLRQEKFLKELQGAGLSDLNKIVQLFASSPDYDPVSEAAKKYWCVLCVLFPFSTRQNEKIRSGIEPQESIPPGEKEKMGQLFEGLLAFADRETRAGRVVYMSEWLTRLQTFGEQEKLRQLVRNCELSE